MPRYQIWNKKDELYTPSGAVISPEAWIEEFGWIKNPRAVPVISAGLINGGFSGELSQMKEMAERDGAIFDEGLSNQQLLEAIEAFQDEKNAPVDPETLPLPWRSALPPRWSSSP